MLPTPPLPSTRLSVEDYPQPVRSATQILDVLSEFVPGQKLIAQIQFQLANGAYRATIAQRDVTLALPFSAKPGDSLELDVVETEGRIAFAVSKAPLGATEKDGSASPASASTTLSRTGQLIGQLLNDRVAEKPAPLNAGIPVLKAPSTSGNDIAPSLQQAISRSGIFYESHLAAWVNGTFSEAALRLEPQAQLARAHLQNISSNATPLPGTAAGDKANGVQGQPAYTFVEATLAGTDTEANKPIASGSAWPLQRNMLPPPSDSAPGAERVKAIAIAQGADQTSNSAPRTLSISQDLAPIVQQQLASLANNVYPFQGALWPGQQVFWEIIDENGGQGAPDSDEATRQWKTRLKLLLPSLGDIDAMIELDGKNIVVQMKTSETDTQSTLKRNIEGLRSRLDLAGLRLMALEVKGYADDEATKRS